jgi:hypothetical protein
MGGVPVPVMGVVDMVAVGHRDMATPLTVGVVVLVIRVGDVPGGFTLVPMSIVSDMQVPVVGVVHVIAVGHRDVPTAVPMGVIMLGVRTVFGTGHDGSCAPSMMASLRCLHGHG